MAVPVDGGHHHVRAVGGEQRARARRGPPPARRPRTPLVLPAAPVTLAQERRHPGSAHGPQLTDEAGPALGAALGGQRVEEGVGGGVVRPGPASRAREAIDEKSDEEVERQRRAARVQIPRPGHLRREHRGQRRRRLARSTASSRTPAAWTTPRSGGQRAGDLGQGRAHVLVARDVARDHADHGAVQLEPREPLGHGRGRGRAPHERQVPGTAGVQPLRRANAERAQPAGDQVASRRRGCAPPAAEAGGVTTSLPTWRAWAMNRKASAARAAGYSAVRERRQPPGRELRRQRGRASSGSAPARARRDRRGRATSVVDVRSDARPSASRPRSRACRSPRTARPGARTRRLAGMKSPVREFSTTSTPRPPVRAVDLVGEVERARVHDVLDAERREQRPLLGAARGREHLGARAAGRARTAARPTPPAAAWMSTRSPGSSRASSWSA